VIGWEGLLLTAAALTQSSFCGEQQFAESVSSL
jgi:hypothetical protein